eukprot:TRINITY_DN9195_c0_g3_i2.p1 TRINITY_DN9195_c0_g3~~TRINITY_DN9195_c0_g3_i2.p1  ORF type:complete len:109 (+),score=6.47 TRINITY_DN9195_c0_g3_i2:261-587(+)
MLDAASRALYPLHSCMNHHCDPNAEALTQGTEAGVRVVARKPLAADSEICISYLDLKNPAMRFVRNRREYLFTNYLFYCRCQRCVQEENNGIDDEPSPTSKKGKKKGK